MQTDAHSRVALGYVAQGGILAAIGLAVLALIGWLLGMMELASFRSEYIPMAPSTALAFLALGSGALAVMRWPTRPAAQWYGRAAAALVLLLSLLVVAGLALGLDPENWLYRPSALSWGVLLGNMSPLTAAALILLGLALLALLAGRQPKYTVADTLSAGAATIGTVVLVGYWYGTPLLYGAAIVPVALPTAAAVLALGTGLLAWIGPRSRILHELIGPSVRAQLLRAFLPVALGLMLLHGWLYIVVLPSLGITNPALGSALTVLGTAIILGGVVWLIARRIGGGVDRAEAGRTQAEAALRESEAKYRALFANSLDAVLLTAPDGAILDANAAACRIFGRTEDELRRGGRSSVVDTTDPRLAAAVAERARTGGFTGELTLLRRDGTKFPGEISTAVFTDPGEQPKTSMVIRDISERKCAEEALRRRAEEWAALYATSLDLTTAHHLPDLLHAIVERAATLLNASGGGLYLCEPERQQVRCVVSYNTPRDFTGVVLKYGEGAAGTVVQTGQPLLIDDYRTWPGRAVVFDADQPFSATLSVPLIWQGQVTGVIHVLHDTQTRRFTQADQELLTLFAQQAAIAIANARLLDDERAARIEKDRLVEALKQRAEELTLLNRIGLAITSGLEVTTVLRALDEQCRQVLPVDCFYVALYDAQSGLIRFPLFRDIEQDLAMPPQDVRARPGMTGAVIQRRQTLYVADTFDPKEVDDRQVIRVGGRPARSYVGVPLVLRDEVIGVMSMQNYQPDAYSPEQIRLLETIAAQAAIAVENARLYDAARRYAGELKQRVADRTDELQSALQRLETTDRLRRQFITQVSHELRTPLTNIKTSVFLLERGKPEKHSQYIATLKRESEALHILIEDQLNLLALDVGKAQLNFQPVDVGRLAARLVADRADLVADRGLTLRAESAPDLPPVLADPRLLPQAITHLLAHAADRAARGAEIVLRVAAQRDEQQPWVTVAVVEASQSTADGAGSGLRRVVAEEIVKRHHGKLTFESAIGQGSTFTIWLPAGGDTVTG